MQSVREQLRENWPAMLLALLMLLAFAPLLSCGHMTPVPALSLTKHN